MLRAPNFGPLALVLVFSASCSSEKVEETGFSNFPAPATECGDCYVVNASMVGASGSDLFLSGYSTGCATTEHSFIRRFDGSAWSTVHIWDEFGGLREMCGDSTRGLYGLGYDPTSGNPVFTVQRFDVATGELTDFGIHAVALWLSDGGSLFALDHDAVLRFDGTDWQDLHVEASNLVDLQGTSAEDVRVLRSDGAVLRYDGSGWSDLGGSLDGLRALWVGSLGQTYAVAGEDQGEWTGPGLIARHTGDGWEIAHDAPDDALLAVTGYDDIVYAVGATRTKGGDTSAVVWRGTGGSWKRIVLTGLDAFLWDARCLPSGECFAVGTDNTVLALDTLS